MKQQAWKEVRRQYLQTEEPKAYRKLLGSGQLEKECQRAEAEALSLLEENLKAGVSPWQARELAMERLREPFLNEETPEQQQEANEELTSLLSQWLRTQVAPATSPRRQPRSRMRL